MTQHSRVSIRPGDLLTRCVGRGSYDIALVISRRSFNSLDALVTYVSTSPGQSFTRRVVWHVNMFDDWERVR